MPSRLSIQQKIIEFIIHPPLTIKKSKWTVFLSLSIVVIIFGYLTYKAYWSVKQILEIGIIIDYKMLFLSFLCQVIGVLLAAWIWNNILSQLGATSSFWYDLQVFCASAIARKIPGGVWYAVSRFIMYDRYCSTRLIVLLALAIETIAFIAGGVINLLIGLLLGVMIPNLFTYNKYLFIVGFLLIFFFITVFTPVFIKWILKKIVQYQQIEISNKIITWIDTLRWTLGETVVLMLATGVGYFLALSIIRNQRIEFIRLLTAFNISVLLSPISMWLPGNAGLRDGIIYLSLIESIGDHTSALITLLWRIWTYILEISFGIFAGIFLSVSMKKSLLQKDKPL